MSAYSVFGLPRPPRARSDPSSDSNSVSVNGDASPPELQGQVRSFTTGVAFLSYTIKQHLALKIG